MRVGTREEEERKRSGRAGDNGMGGDGAGQEEVPLSLYQKRCLIAERD